MPVYVYRLSEEAKSPGCPRCQIPFEVTQRMRDDPLRFCPACGAPIERLPQVPLIGHVEKLKGPSASAMAKAGFTQYKRQSGGGYEKTFGSGPDRIGG